MNFIKSDLFGLHNKQPQPSNGDFIVAEPFVADGIFNRTVICLADHNPKSSMGIIMNQPTIFNLHEAIKDLYAENIPLFYGGPVSNDRLFFIHTLGEIIPDCTMITENLYINGNLEIIKDYLNSGEDTKGKIRFFIGCCGWGEKQLDQELNRYSWAVLKNENKNFSKYLIGKGNKYWEKRVNELGPKYKNWLLCPTSPYLN